MICQNLKPVISQKHIIIYIYKSKTLQNQINLKFNKDFERTLETIIYDEFVSKYIGVDIQYQRLSLNKSILGTFLNAN